MADQPISARQRLAALLDAAGVDYDTADAAITAAIAKQIALIAQALELANPARSPEFSAGVEWAVSTLYSTAGQLAKVAAR
ncbi:hypothetical protein GCM10009759_55370 [Kitasatospora saccharophila]|uniref:Uncharacterized protein n=1 Tax=Kitasatospora saccharophila TaxID=407973 RepID=A0ABP5J5F3_9ACTN